MLGLPWQFAQAQHDIRGITGPTFNLYAYPANIPLPEGTSLPMWLFGDMDGGANATHPQGVGYALPQYPGPTLIVNQGETVTVNITNYGIPQPVSLVVTGHEVTASGGTAGLLTQAAALYQTVNYTFTADQPGTYIYHSLDGPNPGLHVEMGLLGVLIVRPADFATNRSAYGALGTEYDQEFLYLLTEVDPDIHLEMSAGHYNHFTNADRYAKVWFVNGRVFPDLFEDDYSSLFPNQPYAALAKAHPGDRVLVRTVNAGQDNHPFHYHGENLTFIARDGRILSSDGAIANLGRSDNTINSAPKQSVDAIWVWTGKELGWDIYGHDTAHVCIDDDNDGFADATSTYPGEWCDDHGKPFPVTLPGPSELTFGAWYSGSPFLGDLGELPPGEGGLNPFAGYFFVWHSHAEKELTTFDIFPGGTLSAVVVLPPDVPID
jgi:FtsP/CotA-like multicopper oxidase with cupredoxin domain